MPHLVDHYLLQLKTFLPAKQREDIAAELGESIGAAIAERERELDRKLNDDEVAELLKGYGHPLLVAGRYLPKQELIGPNVFPIYWYTLQAVVIIVAVIAGVLGGIALLTEDRPGQGLLQVLVDGFWSALSAAAVVTFVFAVIDHESVRLSFLKNFDPRKLDPGIWGVRAAPLSPIPRSDTLFELATVAILLFWWIDWIDFQNVLGNGVAIEFTTAIDPFFWPVIVLCIVDLLRLGVDFVYAYRTRPRVLVRLAINAAWLLLFVLLFRADGILHAIPLDADAVDAERALGWITLSLRVTAFVLAMVTAGLIATDIVRLFRR